MANWVWQADNDAVINLDQVTYLTIVDQGGGNYAVNAVWTAGSSSNSLQIASSITQSQARALIGSVAGVIDVQP